MEAEQRVIEAILHDNKKYDELGLMPEDFTQVQHREMFMAMGNLIESGTVATISSLEIAGVDYGILASYDPFTSANAEFFADKLKKDTKRRGFRHLSLMINDGLKTQGPDELAQTIETEFYRVAERVSSNILTVNDAMFQVMAELEELAKNGKTDIPTGYQDIDNIITGFSKSTLIIIAARTSIGKTAFALNIAANMAKKGTKVCFFSCEMPASAIARRLLASVGHMDHRSLHENPTQDDMMRIQNACNLLYGYPILIDDTPNIHYSNLAAKIRMAKRQGVKCVFVDYLTLIGYGDRSTPRFERVGELVKNLKHLSRITELPLVVMSQLNRQAEGSSPSMAELRQSGEIEEHADMVIFLHRERGQPETECVIAKNRTGPTGKVQLHFDDRHTRFVEVMH